MKSIITNRKHRLPIIPLIVLSILILTISCSRDLDELELATFPTTAEVFIDGFSAGLNYSAFAGSKVTAFDVDTEVKYAGSESMKFEVPDFEDPSGAYAGGAFYTDVGRDLTGYDALTFWAKASKSATIDVVGFGNDLAELKYVATVVGLKVNTNWRKYFIPIPDPSKLTEERGMFFYSEGPEEGAGYTFWIDEVKFEKLGTIAHPKPAILEEQDQTTAAESGDNLTIGGLFAEYNLPTGVNQRVEIAPSYFTFSSSDPSVATVNPFGVVSVIDSGATVVTAKLIDVEAKGSLTIEAFGSRPAPATAAPEPTTSADSVISLFSNVYTNVTVDTWDTGWEFSTADVEDIQIDGDDVKRYKNLNFVGIEFSSQTIDATGMTHFHLDIWTPDPTGAPASFKVLLIDFGANGIFDGGDDVSHELTFTSPSIATGSWVGLDIPLSSFTGLTTRGHVAQLVLSGDLPTIYLDNVYFANRGGGGGGTKPTIGAPTPTQNAADVISVFSDSYTNLAGTDFNPDWGQSTQVSTLDIAGNNTLLYANFNYQGTQFGGSEDVSSMEFLHVDMWTADATDVQVTPISASGENLVSLTPIVPGEWNSYDIPLSVFTDAGVTLNDVMQLKFDGQAGTNPSNVYLDNIYFHRGGGGGTEPTVAAPAPTQSASNVLSIFSDSYTNLAGTDFNPDWGQSTIVTTEDIAGNSTLKYANFNYQGTQFAGSEDVSTMQFLHVDMWTADATVVLTTPISAATGENLVSLTPIVPGQWNSYNIPLSVFTDDGMSLNDLIQIKFDGQTGVTPSNIYLDNIYFYRGGGGGNEPVVAAPTPNQDAADVISVFSDAYTNIAGTDLNPNWGQGTIVSEVLIEGNKTLFYKGLNYQGIQLGSSQDVSGMGFVHVDFWTANSSALNVFIISTGPVETAYALSVPTSGWASIDIPLTDFSPVDLKDIIQFKFDGDGDIYLDNIYFHK